MCNQMLSKFKYNHAVWFKYSFSSLGFDMYLAEFESSLPKCRVKLAVGKWFIDARVFKWQVLINKMTKQQLERTLLSQEQVSENQNNSFHHPTFGF